MRYLFGFILAFCLANSVAAKAPMSSLTPVARDASSAEPVIPAPGIITSDAGLASFRPTARPEVFEAVLAAGGDAKLAANWVTQELFG